MRPIDAALWYAGQGIPVFPCHGNGDDGLCACGRPDCDGQGKHPITSRGFKDATTDAATVEGWFRDCPQRLIGTAHFNVLDFDLYRPGVRDFYEKVAPTWTAELSPTPATAASRSSTAAIRPSRNR